MPFCILRSPYHRAVGVHSSRLKASRLCIHVREGAIISFAYRCGDGVLFKGFDESTVRDSVVLSPCPRFEVAVVVYSLPVPSRGLHSTSHDLIYPIVAASSIRYGHMRALS